MLKFIMRTMTFVIFVGFLPQSYSSEVKFFKSSNLNSIPTNLIPNKSLILSKFDSPEVGVIQVGTIMGGQNIRYHIAFLLSRITYSAKIVKFNIQNNQIIILEDNYPLNNTDRKQLFDIGNKNISGDCPDNSTFIVASPLYSSEGYPTVKLSIDKITKLATSHGFVVKQLLDNDANGFNYITYLACPNVHGFYSIGHGASDMIFLNDGILDFYQVSKFLKNRLNNHVIEFNSCEVSNIPFVPTFVLEGQAQKYIGGVTTLKIGPSEETSNCFWENVLNGHDITSSLIKCNAQIDSGDLFGINGFGSDSF